MTKRNHIVLLLAVALALALWLTPRVFADKQHAARVEKTVQLDEITHFEGIKVCESGPECPQPWLLYVRAPYTFETGQETDVVDAPEDDVVEPDVALIDALLRDALDGNATRQGVNEKRGHGKGNGNGGG